MTAGIAAAQTQHTLLATRLGELTIVRHADALVGLYFPRHWPKPDTAAFGTRTEQGFEEVARQLDEYFAGERSTFDLPIEARGTELQCRVWGLITEVPYGQTTTDGDLARRVGGDVSAQDVGAAVGRNPLCILIPCHRVIGSTGKLTGYAGGLGRKRTLLEMERARTVNRPHTNQGQGRLPGMTGKQPFEAVVAAHGATVLRVCRAVLGPVDADDAWSETFLSAMKAYPDLPADADVEAWLVTIAHRKAIDITRAAARRAVPVAETPDTEPAPAADSYGHGLDSDLADAVTRLPAKQRQAVAYHYLAGLPYADVAAILGGSTDAIRRAAADGIAALRRTGAGTPSHRPSDPPSHRRESRDEHR